MNRLDNALHELSEIDGLAQNTSPVHRLGPLTKLLTTLIFIIFVVSYNKYDLTGMVPMLLYVVILSQMSGIPLSTGLYKLRMVLPLVAAVGVINPFLDRVPVFTLGNITVTAGVISMLTLILKGVLCLLASFLLIATTPVESLCYALRRLHVPGIIVTLLLLTYRYVSVLTREAATMTDAYHLRAPGQKGIHRSAWGSFFGQLLLRSMDKAEDLYSSMQLRGFASTSGNEFQYAAVRSDRSRDILFFVICTGFMVLVRFVNISRLIGSFFIR